MATTPLEQKFGILANATLTDKMPGLDEDSLGFQIVQTEEDDSRAFGVQVYNIGKHLVLVPMFFLDGKVKGGEVMFVKDLNKFLPLTEVEVNNLESGKTFSMGEPEAEVEKNKGTAYRTSTMELNWLNSKRAGEVGIVNASDIMAMHDAAVRMGSDQFPVLKDIALFGPKAAADLTNRMLSTPDLANALLAAHTPLEIKEALDPVLKAGEKIQKIRGMKWGGKLRFVEDPFSKEAADLSDEQKIMLMRNGIVALDNRKEASVALKERKAVQRWGTPSSNGRYDLVMKDGSTVKADVIFVGSTEKYEGDCCCCDSDCVVGSRNKYSSRVGQVAVFMDGKVSFQPVTDVCVDTMTSKDTEIGEKPSVDNLRSRVVKKGESSWNPNKSFSRNCVLMYDGKHDVSYKGHIELDNKEIVLSVDGYVSKPLRLVLTGKPGTMFEKGGILYIPESAKMVVLEDYDSTNNIGCRPADIASEALVNGGLETVKVASDGRSFRVDDSHGGTNLTTYQNTLKYLMKEVGLREKQANDIMEAARSNSRNGQLGEPVSFWCKCAFADPADDPWFGIGDDQSLTLEAGKLGGPLDAGAIERISKASRTGVKEIIDTQVMSELAKSAYSVDKVHDYLGVFMKALDRICRTLVLFYWHNEDFEERYGKQNMAQLEDALKDNIRSLGDLVNYLRDKTVQDEEGSDDDETDDLSQEMA